jgi:hypothetical protein
VKSPIPKKDQRAIDALLPQPPGQPPSAWHIIESFSMRLLLHIVEPVESENEDGHFEWPPEIDAIAAGPGGGGDDPLGGGAIDGATLRRIPIEAINAKLYSRWASGKALDRLAASLGDEVGQPLRRPDRSDPDRFSQHVAAAYLIASASTTDPTAELHRQVGLDVPKATVARWVGDARKRGHLPTARETAARKRREP